MWAASQQLSRRWGSDAGDPDDCEDAQLEYESRMDTCCEIQKLDDEQLLLLAKLAEAQKAQNLVARRWRAVYAQQSWIRFDTNRDEFIIWIHLSDQICEDLADVQVWIF